MSRFLTSPEFEVHLDALFGTSEWRNGTGLTVRDRRAWLLDLYKRQLRELCGFAHVWSFEMISPGGQHSYYLVYATNHQKGVEIMKDAMWAIDPSGGYRFSARLAGQQVLFSETPDTAPLRKELHKQFGGTTVSIERLESFVTLKTPYKKSHLKTLTLKPMEAEGGIAKVANRRKDFTYPGGSRITFA